MDTKKKSMVRGEKSIKDHKRSCTNCHTTKTPLWRGGPSGPKSLCNACGIRFRKIRKGGFALKEGEDNQKKVMKQWLKQLKNGGSLKRVMFQHKLAEEEEAAFLLMAISSGLVYA